MIFTFYGFKGGVGRTLAVVHAATILASTRGPHGSNVLVMDLDLEAPSAFLYLPPGHEEVVQPGRGFVELMAEFLDDHRDAEWLRQELPRVVFEAAPGLFVLPSGNYTDPRYLESAQRLDEAYEAGFFEALKDACDRLYDYVLIDSRTGLAEIAAAATIYLGDVLVPCFRPNQANLGVGMIVQRFLAHKRLHKDDADAPIIPLLTPRPASHSPAAAKWAAFYQEQFFGPHRMIVQVPFDASLETGDAMIIRPGSLTAQLEDGKVMAAGDDVADLGAPIIAAYIELAERIASFNTVRDVIAARKAELAAFLDQRYVDALNFLFQAIRRQPDSREHWNTLMRRYVPAVLDAAETPARDLIRHFLSECLGEGPRRLESARGRAWAHVIRAAKFGKTSEDGMADVEAALALAGDAPDIANDANFLAAQIIRFRNEKALRAGDVAALATRKQELRQALRHLDDAVATGGETERIVRFSGELHRELGEWDDAVRDFDRAALLTGAAPAEALLESAQTLERAGRYGEAVRRYLAAVKAAPYNEEVYRRFVPTLYRLGYFDEACHRLDQWRRMNAVSPEPSRYALACAVTRGDPREIEEWLTIVRRQQAPPTRIVAWALLRLGQYEEAQECVVDDIDSGAYERFQLALAFACLERDSTAILALPAESAGGGNYLALAAAALGMPDIARSHIQSCFPYEEVLPLAWRTNLQLAAALVEATETPSDRRMTDALLVRLRDNVENAQWTRQQIEMQMVRQLWSRNGSRSQTAQQRWDEIMRAWDGIEMVPFEQFEPFDVPLQSNRR